MKLKYFKNLLSNNIKLALKTENLIKIITQPWKIPVTIYGICKNTIIIIKDIKLSAPSAEYRLNTISSSVTSLAALSKRHNPVNHSIKNIREVFNKDASNDDESNKLGELFKFHGSDKSTTHDYYIAYAEILKNKKNKPINILEIGLGTNNIDVLSNMGVDGRPGASLRAFRDMYKMANVFGADIDKRILFTEERIATYYVDQTSMATFNELKSQLGSIKFDLIIDDGLHNSQANLNTTNFALDLLENDGVFLIEDIDRSDFQYYQIVEAILKDKFSVDFLETKSGDCICVFSKKTNLM